MDERDMGNSGTVLADMGIFSCRRHSFLRGQHIEWWCIVILVYGTLLLYRGDTHPVALSRTNACVNGVITFAEAQKKLSRCCPPP